MARSRSSTNQAALNHLNFLNGLNLRKLFDRRAGSKLFKSGNADTCRHIFDELLIVACMFLARSFAGWVSIE